jgi:CHAD domain-containing protein
VAKLVAGEKTGEGFRQIASQCLVHIARHKAGALRRDAEALHKMRVGVRRLRSVFTTFKPALDPRKVRALRAELRWLQGVLGQCRDWDVFNGENAFRLKGRLAEDESVRAFTALCAKARERAYDQLERAVASRRYAAIHDRLRRLLDDVEGAGTKWTARPLGKFAARRLQKRARKLHDAADRLAVMTVEELHEFRKTIKKLRYAIEFFGDLYRKKHVTRQVAQLSRMQDLIGTIVDVRAGQALIDGLKPRRAADKRIIATVRHIVTGWMAANSADCRERLQKAWSGYQRLHPFR